MPYNVMITTKYSVNTPLITSKTFLIDKPESNCRLSLLNGCAEGRNSLRRRTVAGNRYFKIKMRFSILNNGSNS